jgi:hypothetical protein
MGRQFSFYLLPSDANSLVKQLKSRFGAKLLLDYSPDHELFEIDMPYRKNDSGGLEPIVANARYYLARSSGKTERKYCAKPDWWVVNSDSEGIEFSGCKFNGIAVAIGRFWYETNVVRNLQYVAKSVEFVKWAESVYRYTKKSLHYDPRIDAYLGGDALHFSESGGQLVRDIWPNGKVIPQ